jgi:hypothetical protein
MRAFENFYAGEVQKQGGLAVLASGFHNMILKSQISKFSKTNPS